MAIKRVDLTQRVVSVPGRIETRDVLDQTGVHFLEKCGMKPVIIPNRHTDVVNNARRLLIEDLIFSRGNNISGKLAKWTPKELTDIKLERDEKVLIR
jgi:hypothetical protein